MMRLIRFFVFILLVALGKNEANATEQMIRFGGDVNEDFVGYIDTPADPRNAGIVAILIPGTAVSDPRNAPWDIYNQITNSLTRQGISVARFEPPMRRRSGAGNNLIRVQEGRDLSIATERSAIASLAKVLRERPFAYKKVIFVGHSLGAFVSAQEVAKVPGLVDGYFSYGMSVRPFRETTKFMTVNVLIATVENILDASPSGCASNEQIKAGVIHNGLVGLMAPAERWSSPTGYWCKTNLSGFETIGQKNFELLQSAALQCQQRHVGPLNSGNSCEEIELFFLSHDSILSLLKNSRIPIGIAIGKNDALINFAADAIVLNEYVRENSSANVHFLLIKDAGHMFGAHPILGPPMTKALDEFAQFVKDVMF